MINEEYNLQLRPGGPVLVVHCSQYDVVNDMYAFYLLWGNSRFDDTGYTAKVSGTKPDKKGFEYSASFRYHSGANSYAYVVVSLTKQMTCVPGPVRCKLELTKANGDFFTAPFILMVDAAGLADDVDISDSVLPDYIDAAERAAREAASYVDSSEAWARGTRNGTPVTQGDETYQNNSKYYSEQSAAQVSLAAAQVTLAQAQAQAAAGSATTADTNAKNAEAWAVGKRGGTDVPSSDQTYHNNSKWYAGQASDSADDAADSAAAAAASVAQGTQVDFWVQGGILYIQQTIQGVVQPVVALGSVTSPNTDYTFSTISDMNTAIGNGDVITGGMCYVAEGGGFIYRNESGTAKLYASLQTIGDRASGSVVGYNSLTVGYDNTATGNASHAQGYHCVASQVSAHAEGWLTEASGICSHAEGGIYNSQSIKTTASAYSAHAEGGGTTASASYAHAEGYKTQSSNKYAHAEGNLCVASGQSSHAEGESTTASNTNSHAEGNGCLASAGASHAEGYSTQANGACSHAEGKGTITKIVGQHAGGEYNVANNVSGNYMIIGNGTADDARSNCFRVNTSGVYGNGAYNSGGADYAEYFEWLDGNESAEDRTGRFVTLDGDKIRLANADDDFILGIVSGNASIIGDSHDDQWAHMYERDIFGRFLFEDVEIPAETREIDGEIVEIIPAYTDHRLKLNPEYDNTQVYLPRSQRSEWDTVGMVGKLIALDDGTCQVNGYCAPGDGGIATASEDKTRFRVIKRLGKYHIQIVIV